MAGVKLFKSLCGGSMVFIWNKNTFKVHGRVYGMNFVCLMLRYKINTVDIHFIFSALDKQSVQVIVDIFFEFLKILFFNTSETIVNILEIQNL